MNLFLRIYSHRRNRPYLKSFLSFMIFLFCLSTDERLHGQDQKEIDLSPSEWIMLREVNGEWVIYHYCFAGVGTITLRPSERGGTELIVFSGQDSEIFDVVNMSRTDDAIVLRIKYRYGEQVRDVFFRYDDADARFGEWEELYSGSPAVRTVLNAFENEVRHVYENNGDCDPGR